MTTTTVRRYTVWCETEQELIWSYGYLEEPLTVCPHDETHTIDVNSITPQDSITQDSVFIQDRTQNTGGHQLTKGYTVTIPATTPGTKQRVIINAPPYPTRVNTFTVNPGADNVSDIVDAFSAPNTVMGTLTAAAAIDDVILTVSTSVIENIKIGHMVILGNASGDDLGYVINTDSVNSQITVTNPVTQAWSIGTLVLVSIPRIINFKIASTAPLVFGAKPHGSAFIPADLPIAIDYISQDGVAKEISFTIDLFY